MTAYPHFRWTGCFAAAVWIAATVALSAASPGQKNSGKPPKTPAANSARLDRAPGSAPQSAQMPIPKSEFVIPANVQEGRNPFFPQAFQPAKTSQKSAQGGVEPNAIVVNGITSPPKQTVMLNGTTFEPGEAGDIRLPDGTRLPVRCLLINRDSVIIEVDGNRREIKFRAH